MEGDESNSGYAVIYKLPSRLYIMKNFIDLYIYIWDIYGIQNVYTYRTHSVHVMTSLATNVVLRRTQPGSPGGSFCNHLAHIVFPIW